MRKRSLPALALLAAISGCATTAGIQPEEVRIDPAHGQLVPARTFINRQQPVPRFYLTRLEAVEAALKQSGAFFDVGSHVDSPVVLDIELNRGTTDGTLHAVGHVLSAATLFLVPSKANNFNELRVVVYVYGKQVKSYEFRQEYSEVLGLHNSRELATNQGNEFLSIKNLVHQFVNALIEDGILPRVILDQGVPGDAEEELPAEQQATIAPRPMRSLFSSPADSRSVAG